MKLGLLYSLPLTFAILTSQYVWIQAKLVDFTGILKAFQKQTEPNVIKLKERQDFMDLSIDRLMEKIARLNPKTQQVHVSVLNIRNMTKLGYDNVQRNLTNVISTLTGAGTYLDSLCQNCEEIVHVTSGLNANDGVGNNVPAEVSVGNAGASNGDGDSAVDDNNDETNEVDKSVDESMTAEMILPLMEPVTGNDEQVAEISAHLGANSHVRTVDALQAFKLVGEKVLAGSTMRFMKNVQKLKLTQNSLAAVHLKLDGLFAEVKSLKDSVSAYHQTNTDLIKALVESAAMLNSGVQKLECKLDNNV